MKMLGALFKREMRLASRAGGGGAMGVVFFLILVTIVPFAIGPDLNLLTLATLIGLDRLFQADEEDGSLDLLMTGTMPVALLVLAKGIAHWTVTGLPLALAAPLLGLLLALEPVAMGAVFLTLLVGTPALTFIGAVGAALTASLRRGGLVLAVLVLPLMIPVLIFGVSAASAALGGTIPFRTPFLVLCGLSLGTIVIGSIGSALALAFAGE